MTRVPAPLRWLLAAVLTLGLAWSVAVPAWQAPDENAHFGYLQSLGERFALPGDADRLAQSTEQQRGAVASRSDVTAAQLPGRPAWAQQEADAFFDAKLPDDAKEDGGGPNPASSNPPLYYLSVLPAYVAGDGASVFGRLHLARAMSVLWLIGTVVGVWLLIGELFGRRRDLQLLGAGIAGLLPMVTFESATITPDAGLYATWSIALWLGIRTIKQGATTTNLVALAGVTAAAILVKTTSFALIPAVGLAALLGLHRTRDLRAAVAGIATFAVPVLIWLVISRSTDRQAAAQLSATSTDFGPDRIRNFFSYLWQFYLPKAPFMDEQSFLGRDHPLWDAWVRGGWGAFGWLEAKLPEWIYGVLAALTAATFAAAARLGWLARKRGTVDLGSVAFLALAAVALLAGLHWTDFNQLQGGASFMQGRYLLPIVGVFATLACCALLTLPERFRRPVIGSTLGLLLTLQVLSLATTLTRFYA